MDDSITQNDLYCFAYTSVSSVSLWKYQSGYRHIIEQSNRNNRKYGITGVIYHNHGRYYQYVEGDEKSLTDLKNRLLLDDRHHHLIIHSFAILNARRFDNWQPDVKTSTKQRKHKINARVSLSQSQHWQGDDWLIYLDLITGRIAKSE